MYSKVDSGVKVYRSRKNLGYSVDTDIDFGKAYPLFAEFVLPGDVLKIGARIFARYQPTLAPILNGCKIRMRYFFINLRQIEAKTETVLTGSHDGQTTADVPVFKSFIDDVTDDENYDVSKWSFWDYLGIPCKNYKKLKGKKCIPAEYWFKGYKKVEWDYYRDENIDTGYEDFESWFEAEYSDLGGSAQCFSVNLRKDYFTSATPFELKGEIPTFEVETTDPFVNFAPASHQFTSNDQKPYNYYGYQSKATFEKVTDSSGTFIQPVAPYRSDGTASDTYPDQPNYVEDPVYIPNGTFSSYVNGILGVTAEDLNYAYGGLAGSFNARDVRRMFALTRIKERDMRCGSRYTEYLRANFKTAPADETLQRPVYLGGFTQPIVTNEVLQTGEGSNPVGTMRGKGITDGGNSIKPYHAKEFGILLGLVDVLPDLIYTQGIDRRFTYKSRYDFFNPSFQNLSEQEIRNGEIYIDEDDDKNDETFGFQGMYNELRSHRNIVTGDMRDNLKYWTQAIEFDSRPNWNDNFIKAENYAEDFKRPFAVDTDLANPIIIHVDNVCDAYRPMVSEPTPGLVDHN